MYRFLAQLVQPYTFAIILLGIGLLVIRRRTTGRRRWLNIAHVAYALLFLMSLNPVTHFALGSLEWQYEPLDWAPDDAPAMIVLSAGDASLRRCERAAALYRPDIHQFVIASGGQVLSNDPVESDRMEPWLTRMGIPAARISAERESLSTYENAVQCAAILRERGIGRVVLVTDAAHMPRAVACFRRQGIDVVPAICDRVARRLEWRAPEYYLPKPGAAVYCEYALREWLGLTWYWIKGRI